jgi:sensor histidine kinase YesM
MTRIKRKIWLPVAIWLALFLFVFNLANYFQEAHYAFANAFFEVGTSCSIFYFTALVLFNRFYKKGKGYFWISVLFLLVVSFLLLYTDLNFIGEFRGHNEADRPPVVFQYIRYFLSSGFTYFVATSLSLMEQTRELQANEKVLSEEKLETELKLLKAQINPHFIFNALNNIYSLTYMKSANAPDSVLKLSEMLRYVFYECDKDRVPLSAEIKYIENFTGFQQMKSEYNQNITLQSAVNGETLEIAPMLFIPFLENAFKYSRIEENENAHVAISIKQEKEKLYFAIENSIPESKTMPGSGMGIKNVKHRLDIIYPGKYDLRIEEKEGLYRVDLRLEI